MIAADLVNLLASGVYKLAYTKLDGTQTLIEATLDPALTPPAGVKPAGVKPAGVKPASSGVVRFYSPDRKGWRSVVVANVNAATPVSF